MINEKGNGTPLGGERMPSFKRIRDSLPTATVSQAIGTIHPPFVFAPVYTISPLHFKRIFES